MNKRRLLKLATFLRTVPRKSFNIGAWQAREADKPEGEKPGDCGFAGCAMGWAAHAKLFRGLTLYHDGAEMLISYEGGEGFRGAAKLFDIEYEKSNELFSPNYYVGNPTPLTVAKRIECLIKTGETGRAP